MSQPDFYMGFLDGMVRIWPAWEVRNLFGHYMIPAVFFPSILGATVLMIIVIAYPWIEKAFTKDDAHPQPAAAAAGRSGPHRAGRRVHHLLPGQPDQRRERPVRLQARHLAERDDLGRPDRLSIIGPVIAYVVTYRLCLGLQHADRAVLEHGIETGVLKRLPNGEFIEVHQPLGPVDDHGHPVPLAYQGAPVPKRMNQLGSAGKPGSGGLFTHDPVQESEAIAAAEHEAEHHQLAVLREYQARITADGNGRTGDGNGRTGERLIGSRARRSTATRAATADTSRHNAQGPGRFDPGPCADSADSDSGVVGDRARLRTTWSMRRASASRPPPGSPECPWRGASRPRR